MTNQRTYYTASKKSKRAIVAIEGKLGLHVSEIDRDVKTPSSENTILTGCLSIQAKAKDRVDLLINCPE